MDGDGRVDIRMVGFGAVPGAPVAVAVAGGERVEDLGEVGPSEEVVSVDRIVAGCHDAPWLRYAAIASSVSVISRSIPLPIRC